MLLAPLFFFLFFFLVIKCATNSALHVALFEFDLYFACRSAAYDQGFTSMIQTFQKCWPGVELHLAGAWSDIFYQYQWLWRWFLQLHYSTAVLQKPKIVC